jgi:hypothetical protein
VHYDFIAIPDEAHPRDFLEHGFAVATVRDATAGTKNEGGDG